MKPSWDDAPEWANWLAMGADGMWWWFDERPRIEYQAWQMTGPRCCPAQHYWHNSLEQRPKGESE